MASYGRAKEKYPYLMGVYTMTGTRQHMRPVWEKVDDKGLFLFYSGNNCSQYHTVH